MEIIKQLFDISRIFEVVDDLTDTYQSFRRYLEKQKELWHTSLARQHRKLESNDGIWLSKKVFRTWLQFFHLPLCYTIISICYYLAVWFG